MPAGARELNAELIVETTEELLRRFGPNKLRVVDVARALGMSHGNVYRFFPDRGALLDAVTQRWLHTVTAPLAVVVHRPGPAAERLEEWMATLVRIKHRKVKDDPEMFRAYHRIAEQSRAVVEGHLAELVGQLAELLKQGGLAGDWKVAKPAEAADLLLRANLAYHHPALVQTLPAAIAEQKARATVRCLVAGLKAGAWAE